MEDFGNNILTILFFIMVGMIIGLAIVPAYKYHGPNSRDVLNKIYKQNDKCYIYDAEIHSCPKKLIP